MPDRPALSYYAVPPHKRRRRFLLPWILLAVFTLPVIGCLVLQDVTLIGYHLRRAFFGVAIVFGTIWIICAAVLCCVTWLRWRQQPQGRISN